MKRSSSTTVLRYALRTNLTLLLGICFAVAVSFESRSQSLIEENRSRVVLKWAPLPLFDYYNTFQLGVEVPFPDRRFSFQQELGYGHSSFNVWYYEGASDRPDRHNFRSRTQFRFYLKEWNSFRIFLAGEYFIRKSKTASVGYDGVGCDGGFGCNYYKEARYTTERRADALHCKFGFQTWISPRVSLEVYSGLGLRTVKSRSPTSALGIRWSDRGPWWEDGNTGPGEPIPSVAAGFQLGISLGK